MLIGYLGRMRIWTRTRSGGRPRPPPRQNRRRSPQGGLKVVDVGELVPLAPPAAGLLGVGARRPEVARGHRLRRRPARRRDEFRENGAPAHCSPLGKVFLGLFVLFRTTKVADGGKRFINHS